jgi:hypothetical protein
VVGKLVKIIHYLLVGVFMPLKKSASKKAFKENIKREVKEKKPVKQAVAIAYNVKRKAVDRKNGKKAKGKY